MSCANCSYELPEGAAYCPRCGTAADWVCAACQQPNPALFVHCRNCGEPRQETAAQTRLAPSERKFITVLFADIKGSLALIQGRDPELAASLLDSNVNLMIHAIQAFGGTVNRVMGDGVMAIFGAPRAAEHHALRACLSALRIRDEVARETAREVARDAKPAAPRVQIRVGMASGEAIVKPMVANDFVGYDAAGEIVHLANRMEQLAKPGGILMTPRTARLVARDMAVRSLGPASVKGMPRRMDVYELLRPRENGHAVSARHESPAVALVGRDRELAAIVNARDQAASGFGRVIGISGDAGCGKSRIVTETIRRDPGDWIVLEGQAAAYDQKGYRLILAMPSSLSQRRQPPRCFSARVL